MEVSYEYKGFSPKTHSTEGQEREDYNQIKGFAIKERAKTYAGYLNDRLINAKDVEEARGVANLFTGFKNTAFLADFFTEQENITYAPIEFAKSDASFLKKAFTFLIGSTVSGIVETLYETIGLVKNVAKLVFDSTLGMLWEIAKGGYDFIMDENTADFGDRITEIKNSVKKASANIHQIVRNVIRTIPVIGHATTALVDRVALAAVDGVERVAHHANNARKAMFSSSKPKEAGDE